MADTCIPQKPLTRTNPTTAFVSPGRIFITPDIPVPFREGHQGCPASGSRTRKTAFKTPFQAQQFFPRIIGIQ
jgi:hypothetical protein